MPTSISGRKRLHVLLPTIGSAGDVHPFIGLGLALRARGHRATILTNPYFEGLIEHRGWGFCRSGRLRTCRGHRGSEPVACAQGIYGGRQAGHHSGDFGNLSMIE